MWQLAVRGRKGCCQFVFERGQETAVALMLDSWKGTSYKSGILRQRLADRGLNCAVWFGLNVSPRLYNHGASLGGKFWATHATAVIRCHSERAMTIPVPEIGRASCRERV